MSLDNRGLAYGDGFFTTMAVRDGQVLWADYHWQRLASHAVALQLDIATPHLVSSLKAYAQQLQQGVMKVIVTRATQSLRGYSFAADAAGNACEIWLKLMPSEGQSATDQSATHKTAGSHDTLDTLLLPNGAPVIQQAPSLAVCLSSQIAVLPPTLAGLKSLNRLDNVLASGELEQIKARSPDAGIGEGLLRDMSGQWVEGVMSNVFYQLSGSHTTSSGQQEDANKDRNYLTDGQWYTPPMTQSGVAGVMRQVLIDSLAETQNRVIMRSLADNDLPQISQMFFCNAVRGVMPVSKLTLLSGQVVEFN
ncbi:MAG TPA: aminodeoxychorismate lyase [Psychrobacter sp.]|nr:aminodeoxychorismate lyase [Psychrobacter sp.]